MEAQARKEKHAGAEQKAQGACEQAELARQQKVTSARSQVVRKAYGDVVVAPIDRLHWWVKTTSW